MKYLVTENEFLSAAVNAAGELEFTRDNGVKVKAGKVRPDLTPELQVLRDDTVAAAAAVEAVGVTNDSIMAAVAADSGSQFAGQLSATTAESVGHHARTDGAQMRKAADATSRTVAITGHSLAYGQEDAGPTAPTNGASQKRSARPTTTAFTDQAALTSPSAVVLVNQTFPGDRTSEGLSRWAAGSSGDVELFWLDTNDAKNYASFPDGPLTDAKTAGNMTDLAERARSRGASFVVVGGAPVRGSADSRKIFSSAETERTVAERLGAVYVDVGELLNDIATDASLYWTDGVHLTATAYELIGARLAGLLGAKGTRPPRVSPGRRFTWMDQLFSAGVVTAVGFPNVAASVLRLSVGVASSLSFWAESPVRPLVTLRATSAAVVSVASNQVLNRPPVYRSVPASSAQEFVTVLGPATMSPGPSSVTITAESGSVDIISVEFLPVSTSAITPASNFRPDDPGHVLAPVGGRTRRINVDWDSRMALAASRSMYSGAAQTTAQACTFLFDLRLGVKDSGIAIADAVSAIDPYRVRNGYLIIRADARLIVRQLVNGAATGLADIAGVFPSTGIVQTMIEVAWNGTDLLVYVDNVLQYTIVAPTFKAVHPGIIAGAAATSGLAAGTLTVR